MGNTGAVIVAAGLSSRMGTFKPLLPLNGKTVIENVIEKMQSANIDPIIVVTGHNAELLEPILHNLKVFIVRNEHYSTTQMFDSAKLGFQTLKDKCDRFFFMPVDIPAFSKDTLLALMHSNQKLICPVHSQKKGHPLLIANELIDEILQYPGEDGLRGAIEHCSISLSYLDVTDKGILYDMDTPREYEQIKDLFFR